METDLKQRQCILFIRGAVDDSQRGVERQRLDLLDFARRRHMTVVDDVSLVNVSANGPETISALDQLLKRKTDNDDFDVLLAADLTRMSRGSICRTMELVQKFARAGVDVVTLDNGMIDAALFDTFKVHKRKKGWIRRNEISTTCQRPTHTEAHDGRREQKVPDRPEALGGGTRRERTGKEEARCQRKG